MPPFVRRVPFCQEVQRVFQSNALQRLRGLPEQLRRQFHIPDVGGSVSLKAALKDVLKIALLSAAVELIRHLDLSNVPSVKNSRSFSPASPR